MTICTQDDNCGPVVARGLCNKHYIRLRRSEEFEPHKKPDKCSALDCDRPVKARSVCTKHYKQLYRQENIEKLREQDRVAKQDFRQRNPDYGKQYYVAHTEQRRKATKKWAAAHSDEVKRKARDWQKANPHKVRNNVARRRAAEKSSQLEKIDRLVVFERDGWVCQLCYTEVDKNLKFPERGFATLDHVIPLSKGGSHTYSNVQLAHLSCNQTKSNSILGDDSNFYLLSRR